MQKQMICRFKRRVLPVFENSRGSIVFLREANPVTRHDWAVLFLRTSAGCQTETGTYVKTKPSNHGASGDLLRVGKHWNLWNFQKRAKNDVWSGRSQNCFCAMTVVSSTVFEREVSCQQVDVKMRMLQFFLWRNLALFPGGINQFLFGTFTPVSSLRMIL